MVEYTYDLDSVFASLADETRRKIVQLVSRQALTISQIADSFQLTYGAISKHILVLERAKVIEKRRQGKKRVVSISPLAVEHASEYLESSRRLWEARLDSLEQHLNKEQ
jgi:DNA-binding transcriptional ArsR family regulator